MEEHTTKQEEQNQKVGQKISSDNNLKDNTRYMKAKDEVLNKMNRKSSIFCAFKTKRFGFQ